MNFLFFETYKIFSQRQTRLKYCGCINTRGATCGAATSYPSRAPEFTLGS